MIPTTGDFYKQIKGMRYLRYVLLLAAALMGATACTKEAVAANSSRKVIRIGAELPQTKLTMDVDEGDLVFTPSWNNADRMTLSISNDNDYQADNVSATWSNTNSCFELVAPDGVDTDNRASWTYSATYKPETLGSQRSQDGNSFNGRYDWMTGSLTEEDALFGKKASDPEKGIVIPMERQSAILYFHLKAASLNVEEPLLSATLSVEGYEITEAEDGEAHGGNTIQLNVTDGASLKDGVCVWFNVLPGSATKLTLTLRSEHYACTLTNNSGATYEKGGLYKVVGDISSKWIRWERVTDKSTLIAGGTFIIGYEQTAGSGIIVPMRTEGTASTTGQGYIYSGTTPSASTNGSINMNSLPENLPEYEVSMGESSIDGDNQETVYVRIGRNYIGSVNSENNVLKIFASQGSNTSFTPEFGANDVVSLCNVSRPGRYLQYNHTSGQERFSLYANTQRNLVIYKKNVETAVDPGERPAYKASGWLEMPAEANTSAIRSTTTSDLTDLYHMTHYVTVNDARVRNYSMLYDPEMYASYWVAYPLVSSHTQSGASRESKFPYDPEIPQEKQTLIKSSAYGVNCPSSDYSSEYYARGHQVPNADRSGNTDMQAQTFYATNITPQMQYGFNGNVWKNLEEAVRSKASVQDTLYVISGAAFRTVNGAEVVGTIINGNDNKSLPVPNYYYKAILKVTRNSQGAITAARSIGFWLSHNSLKNNDFRSHITSVDDIEQKTGFNFFHNLPEELQNSCESVSNWDWDQF